MYIRRKVFSTDRYENSTVDVIPRDVYLEDIDSFRGLGRSMTVGRLSSAVGGISGVTGGVSSGILGIYAGKKVADKLDKQGKSDNKILSRATQAGSAAGLGTGVLLITNDAAKKLLKKDLKLGVNKETAKAIGNQLKKQKVRSGLALGGMTFAGYLGSKQNTESRLKKRKDLEDRIKYYKTRVS